MHIKCAQTDLVLKKTYKTAEHQVSKNKSGKEIIGIATSKEKLLLNQLSKWDFFETRVFRFIYEFLM